MTIGGPRLEKTCVLATRGDLSIECRGNAANRQFGDAGIGVETGAVVILGFWPPEAVGQRRRQ